MKGRVCISDEKVRLLYFLITFFFSQNYPQCFQQRGRGEEKFDIRKGRYSEERRKFSGEIWWEYQASQSST
jgi:hypothetical protein